MAGTRHLSFCLIGADCAVPVLIRFPRSVFAVQEAGPARTDSGQPPPAASFLEKLRHLVMLASLERLKAAPAVRAEALLVRRWTAGRTGSLHMCCGINALVSLKWIGRFKGEFAVACHVLTSPILSSRTVTVYLAVTVLHLLLFLIR